MEVSKIQKFMPKAENDEENIIHPTEPSDLSGNRDFLEYGQRHGLLEDERTVSGLKRICFCYGYTRSWCENRFLPCFLVIMYPIVFGMGYYNGINSNCLYHGSV